MYEVSERSIHEPYCEQSCVNTFMTNRHGEMRDTFREFLDRSKSPCERVAPIVNRSVREVTNVQIRR